ncbi:MAG: lipoyl(octanoyl) transferase LipB [Betaproteobacteria bacterium]|nr:lipoyl(octanoyl) transferase LipB [Betaproteobacteria bacterium]
MTAPNIRILGRADYEPTWRAMQAFNAERDEDTDDEIWLVEHPPVFTLGLAGDAAHVLNAGDIPVVKIDRGGQVTYHGPGQLVCYLLLDIRRLGYGVKSLVRRIEESVVALLGEYSLAAHAEPGMPGVYIGEGANLAKISAVGLRVSRHCTYHGLSLNIDMDLEPFSRINPCGYPNLKATQLSALGVSDKISVVGDKLVARLQQHLY